MISFILLNNLNFSCCIGYPHAHMSTRKCLVNYHSWNVGVCSMVLTWPYPPNTVLKCLPFLLPLNSHVLFYSWEVLCWIWIGCHPGTEDISANEKQAITTNLFQDISVKYNYGTNINNNSACKTPVQSYIAVMISKLWTLQRPHKI